MKGNGRRILKKDVSGLHLLECRGGKSKTQREKRKEWAHALVKN